MKDFDYRKAAEALAARAAQDVAFRKQLLRDPRAAIQLATGTAVPEQLRVKFVEKDPDVDVMIVLPDLVTEEDELTEDDVASVAGGTNWGCQDDSTA